MKLVIFVMGLDRFISFLKILYFFVILDGFFFSGRFNFVLVMDPGA